MAKSNNAGGRWTVRDISPDLQRRAKAAADRAGMKLGPWVSAAIERALKPSAASPDTRISGKSSEIEGIKRRLARLEQAGGNARGAKPRTTAGAVPASTDIDVNGPEFQAAFSRVCKLRLLGASAARIRDALGVSEELAQALSDVRA